MSRRVVIGQQADGSVGLRCSLPGVDALTASSVGGTFSFDSAWRDIVQIALTGTASVPGGSNTSSGVGVQVPVSHGLGYVPFVEVRLLNGSTISDDTVNLTSAFSNNYFSGAPVTINSSTMLLQPQASGNLSGGSQPFVGYTVLYVVYAVPVPNPS